MKFLLILCILGYPFGVQSTDEIIFHVSLTCRWTAHRIKIYFYEIDPLWYDDRITETYELDLPDGKYLHRNYTAILDGDGWRDTEYELGAVVHHNCFLHNMWRDEAIPFLNPCKVGGGPCHIYFQWDLFHSDKGISFPLYLRTVQG